MFSDFTYADLRRIYDRIRERARNCLTFGELGAGAELPATYFMIRHDIDYALDKATELAERERDWGYRSTYFVLPSCDHYNVLSREGCRAVRALAALGHEVGLHYDVQVMAARGNGDMAAQLKFELGVLADVCGGPIRSIAMHNPSIYGEDPFAEVDFVTNAYRADLIDQGGYFSDSAGAWRDHAVDAIGGGRLPDRVQLLIHPVLWGEEKGDRFDRLDAWRALRHRDADTASEEVRSIWHAHAGAREHDRREAQPER